MQFRRRLKAASINCSVNARAESLHHYNVEESNLLVFMISNYLRTSHGPNMWGRQAVTRYGTIAATPRPSNLLHRDAWV